MTRNLIVMSLGLFQIIVLKDIILFLLWNQVNIFWDLRNTLDHHHLLMNE
jgi:hypothetical protein